MTAQMILPQEIETFYVIPALRRQVALALQEKGMKQKDVASILGISTSAISQYRSHKRGHKIDFPVQMQQEIGKSAAKITDRLTYIREMQRLLYVMRLSGSLCTIHKQLSNTPAHCEIQSAGCHLTAQGA